MPSQKDLLTKQVQKMAAIINAAKEGSKKIEEEREATEETETE